MRSMTGFGRGQAQAGEWGVVVEVKTVNHKGLDVKLRLPRALNAHEHALSQQIRSRLERGRVDVVVDLESPHHEHALRLDHERVAAVVAAVAALAQLHPSLSPTLTAADLLRLPGVLSHDDDAPADLEALQKATSSALTAALDELEAMRASEGQGLQKELSQRRVHCVELVQEIAAKTTTSSSEKRARLQEKLAALGDSIDPVRVAAEAALLLERLDVSEELARLRLHLEALDVLLGKAGSGRKLDFLCQELLREANTTASKCQDAAVAQRVVDLKAEIERVREQAQNIE